MKKALLLALIALLGLQHPAQAQRETVNWRFGTQAGLVFPATGSPLPMSNSALIGREACSSVSDPAGNLLCYASPERVWDRANVPMPNGVLMHSNLSSTQGALLVTNPGNARQHYLFTVDAVENNLVGGLRYSIVDMSLRGGMGDIGAVKEVAVPVPGNAKLTEKLTAIRHANGRDFWIVVHGYGSDAFFSYLLTASGVSLTPVVSSLGSVHTGGGSLYANGNAVGYIRASPNGQRLAVAIRETAVEVFDFSPATGQVSNYRPVALSSVYYYGLEFSPNGSKLYVTDLTSANVWQVDLLSATLRGQVIGRPGNYTGAVLRGLDGKLYTVVELSNYLAAIPNPDNPGTSCGFVVNGAYLGAGQGRQGLPNFPNALPLPAPPLTLAFAAPLAICAGSTLAVSILASALPAGSSFAWNFGDPAAAGANTAIGATASHSYSSAGTYTVTLTATTPSGSLTTQKQVVVNAIPTLSLGPDVTLCDNAASVLLQANAQPPGSTYRWQDGSAAATYLATAPGTYRLEVRNAAGCLASAAIEITPRACRPVLIPNIITPNNDPLNQTFFLQGLTAADWAVHIYNRWGREIYRRESYDNTWAAQDQSDGIYYYLLTNAATGQHIKGWLEVRR